MIAILVKQPNINIIITSTFCIYSGHEQQMLLLFTEGKSVIIQIGV